MGFGYSRSVFAFVFAHSSQTSDSDAMTGVDASCDHIHNIHPGTYFLSRTRVSNFSGSGLLFCLAN